MSNSTLRVSDKLIEAAGDQTRIQGIPHSIYKYPARFSPKFARAVIEEFTNPGDVVLDPFCGGGTTLVESLSSGRRAIGSDLSSLAAFISATKSEPLLRKDVGAILEWGQTISCSRKPASFSMHQTDEPFGGYVRNLPDGARRFLNLGLDLLDNLENERQRQFARLLLLATGQWGLESTGGESTWIGMKRKFLEITPQAVRSFRDYYADSSKEFEIPCCKFGKRRRILCSKVQDLQHQRLPWVSNRGIRLILTSPPYPGVHVLYHRWQVGGRKETPAPFWVANSLDGSGESYYTMGCRKQKRNETYFENLHDSFQSLRTLASESTLVVQLVAFSNPDWQLPAYLDSIGQAGFREFIPQNNQDRRRKQRIWREVPGRKWHAASKGRIPCSKEVLLFHRPV